MEEFLICVGLSAIISIVATVVGDYGFHQHWNFFAVFFVVLVLLLCGEYIDRI